MGCLSIKFHFATPDIVLVSDTCHTHPRTFYHFGSQTKMNPVKYTKYKGSAVSQYIDRTRHKVKLLQDSTSLK